MKEFRGMFKKHKEQEPTRNKGLENAKGDYLYFFDVDDEIYPNALKKMIDVLDNHPDIEAVFGKMMKSSKGISETPKPLDETNELIIKTKTILGITSGFLV